MTDKPDVTDKTAEEPKKLRQIAMIGTAPSTRGDAPFKDTAWEIWGQADYWKDMSHISRWYEFAPIEKLKGAFPEYMEFLKDAKFPVYMRKHYDDFPTSVPFPFEDMAKQFGREFMSATLVWMICQAVTEHINGDEIGIIGLWGYDLAIDSEYVSQRPGLRHMEWICREYLPAIGKPPITVAIPRGSDLTISPIPYPFAEDDIMVAKIRRRKRDVNARIQRAQQQLSELNAAVAKTEESIQYLNGAMEDLNYFERMTCGTSRPAA